MSDNKGNPSKPTRLKYWVNVVISCCSRNKPNLLWCVSFSRHFHIHAIIIIQHYNSLKTLSAILTCKLSLGKVFPISIFEVLTSFNVTTSCTQLQLEIVNWKLNLGRRLRAPALYNVYPRLRREENRQRKKLTNKKVDWEHFDQEDMNQKK